MKREARIGVLLLLQGAASGNPVSLAGHHAAYLLRTAQLWERPLEHAELEVDFPESLGSPTFSYPFEHVEGLVVEW